MYMYRQVKITQQCGLRRGSQFTFGWGGSGRLGHGEGQYAPVPRLVEALSGKKVVGAAAGDEHTALWTNEGELFTCGHGHLGGWGTARHSLSLCRDCRGAPIDKGLVVRSRVHDGSMMPLKQKTARSDHDQLHTNYNIVRTY